MCFTSGRTSDERGGSLTDGLQSTLLNISGSKRRESKKSKLAASGLSTKEYAGVKTSGAVAKVATLARAASPSKTESKDSRFRTAFKRLGSSAEIKSMQKTEAMTNGLSTKGVGSKRIASNSFTTDSQGRSARFVGNSAPIVRDDAQAERFLSNSEIVSKDVQSGRFLSNSERAPKGVQSERYLSNSERVSKDVQSERFAQDSDSTPKLDKKTFISAQFMSKVNSKQMKGVMKGMGKELRRAASTVGEKLPNYSTKKKIKEEKDRRELLETRQPQVRHADEIKKAYGHAPSTDNANHAAMITHQKLHERGEKISALQRKTRDLEADAANFSSLAHELAKKTEAKKMESKKWYEF